MAVPEPLFTPSVHGRALVLSEVRPREWRRRFTDGESSSAGQYGVERLAERGLTLLDARWPKGRIANKVADLVDHRSGIPISQPILSGDRAARADVVIALLERFALLPGILRNRHVWPYAGRPVVALACWLGEEVARASEAEGRRLVEKYAGVPLILTWSRNQVPLLEGAGRPPGSVAAVPFGISHRWFTPGDGERDIDVLAVGADAGRDYSTLGEAVRGSGLDLTLIAPPARVRGLELPPEVRFSPPVPATEYRDLLRRSKVVVVPTNDLAYPTGQTVALEAAACGAAVVVTGTEPMKEYLIDGRTARLVPVGDAEALRAALTEVLGDDGLRARLARDGRAAVVARFTTERMWDEVLNLLLERGWVETSG